MVLTDNDEQIIKSDNQQDIWLDVIRSGKLSKIRSALKKRDVDARAGILAPTALHIACGLQGIADTDQIVALLLDSGAAIDRRHVGRAGMTPLMIAAYYENVEVVRLLLERGANALLRAHDGELALDFVEEDEGEEMRQMLKQAVKKALKAKKKKDARAAEEQLEVLVPTAVEVVERLLRGEEAKSKKSKKSEKKKAVAKKAQKEEEEEKEEKEDDNDGKECVICMDESKSRNCTFQPCFHVCCCFECAETLKDCPICRKPIEKKIQLFNA